jgi:hypothetical protein
MKLLAFIVGAGGVAVAATELGKPWYLALLAAAFVTFTALK